MSSDPLSLLRFKWGVLNSGRESIGWERGISREVDCSTTRKDTMSQHDCSTCRARKPATRKAKPN